MTDRWYSPPLRTTPKRTSRNVSRVSIWLSRCLLILETVNELSPSAMARYGSIWSAVWTSMVAPDAMFFTRSLATSIPACLAGWLREVRTLLPSTPLSYSATSDIPAPLDTPSSVRSMAMSTS